MHRGNNPSDHSMVYAKLNVNVQRSTVGNAYHQFELVEWSKPPKRNYVIINIVSITLLLAFMCPLRHRIVILCSVGNIVTVLSLFIMIL